MNHRQRMSFRQNISVFAILALGPSLSLHGQGAKKHLTVETAVKPGTLVATGISRVKWRPGGDEFSFIRQQGSGKGTKATLRIYNIQTQKESLLLEPGDEKEKLDLSSYQWSPKGDALLLAGENDLWLVDAASLKRKRLTADPEPEEDATFSPTGERIAFVKKNDIYTLDLNSGLLRKLTADGSETVRNGKLDWVYEEELANRATSRAYQWSPDGKKIAYLRLDDGPVPQYPLTQYLATHVELSHERFPQAGDPNPVPSFHCLSVEEGGTETRSLSLESKKTEYIGPEFSWTPDSQTVIFLTLNRAQNEVTVHLWTPARNEDRQLLTEKDATWINSLTPPRFLADGKRFLWLSERDGWLHLYLCDRDGKVLHQLTRGAWMIDHAAFSDVPMFQVEEKSGWVYFAATNPDPRERQLYRTRLTGEKIERLSKAAGTHSLDLSPRGDFLIDSFSDYQTPPETRLLSSDGAYVATVDKPENHLAEYAPGKTEFVEVKAADGTTLYARLLKPADFSPEKKYPVIVDVYGGPHVQLIADRWGVSGFLDQLLAQEGFLVWSLDNRGSWGRGHAWESAIFKNMGRRELEDQLAGVQYLRSLPFVDANRLGIWGWSYGGYMTLYSLTHAPDIFKCGAAGGPVTAWKFYDSIYTERYMRTPQENPEGYAASSPLEAATNLKAKLLLIQGTDDDNVHMQNTMNFINALVSAGKPFELYLQPGQKHGFQGETVRTYLYRRLIAFFKQNL